MNSIYDKEIILRAKNIGVYYSRRVGFLKFKKYWAIENISFDVYHGETLGIIGRNGAGKSSILKVISGIIQADSGEIEKKYYSASLLALQVGFINYLTGKENLILSGLLLGMNHKEIKMHMNDIIKFSELEDVINEPVSSYSVGMRARLGFAIAIYANPDIILIDEALGVGDAKFKKKSNEEMRNKIKSNKTVILVSHNMATIRELCDRVVWIENGRAVEVGPTEAVVSKYEYKYN